MCFICNGYDIIKYTYHILSRQSNVAFIFFIINQIENYFFKDIMGQNTTQIYLDKIKHLT